MSFVNFVLIASPVLGLLYLFRRYRMPAGASPKAGLQKREIPSDERNKIRSGIVKEADHLCELEAEVTRFGEGTGSTDILPDTAERARIEAVGLRNKLEAQCRRHGMPIGLVRRSRSATLNPTVGPLECKLPDS